MRLIGGILLTQCSALIVVLGCVGLLHGNLFLLFKTTYNAGPPIYDPIPLNETRRPNEQPTNHLQQNESSRIIFMSCNRQRMTNPFWSVIDKLKPNTLLWMGDNIYADHTGTQWQVALTILKTLFLSPILTLRALVFRSVPLFPPALPSVIASSYSQVLDHPEYQQVLKGGNLQLVTGTWDDHDYGVNDGDKTFVHREISKQYFLDFMKVAAGDPRRSPDHDGVYSVEYIDVSMSHNKALKIAIILLDTRYNKDTWITDRQVGDFLGARQWAWFESVLESSTADIHLIVSSIQVLVDHRSFLESWSGFPNARRRFLNTLLRSGAKNPVFVSGDVHFAEIGTAICRPRATRERSETVPNEIQLWEFTSSGMTHSTRRVTGTGCILDVIVRWMLPTDHVDQRADGLKQIYTGRNIGVLDVISDTHPILSFKILNSESRIVLSKDLMVGPLPWLSHHLTTPSNISSPPNQHWKSVDWICEPLHGTVSPKRVRMAHQLVVLLAVGVLLFGSSILAVLSRAVLIWCRRISRRPKEKED